MFRLCIAHWLVGEWGGGEGWQKGGHRGGGRGGRCHSCPPPCHRPSHRCSLGLGLDAGDLLDSLESLLGLLDLLVDPVPHGRRGCLLVAGLQVLSREWLVAQ